MTLRSLQWEKVPGYADLNRKVGYKEINLDHKGRLPPLEPIATGQDVYNGSFSTFQVSHLRCPCTGDFVSKCMTRSETAKCPHGGGHSLSRQQVLQQDDELPLGVELQMALIHRNCMLGHAEA